MTTASLYLIWSHENSWWWGPGGRTCTQDIWQAGRFSLAEAEAHFSVHTWEPGELPPEVAVEAPETHLSLSTYEEIEAAPILTRRLVDEVTRVAMREHDRAAVTR